MSRVNKYLLFNFLGTFASLFSTLFLIMSIVFFIQIARITSYIEISFGELFKLYSFMLPRVLLFVVPIAFFVSLAMTLVMIPIAAQLNANFIDYKKTVAKLNLKPTQFGQKFSDWMVYVGSESEDKNGTTYKDIVMFNPFVKDSQRLITAKNAKIINVGQSVELSLNEGKMYDIRDEIYHQSNFKSMKIRTAQSEEISDVGSIKEYWMDAASSDKRRKDLSTYVLVALFPLASTLFAISLGIVTYRYEKGMVYVGTFGVLFGYFTLIMLFSSKPALAIPLIFFVFLLAGVLLYKAKITRRY